MIIKKFEEQVGKFPYKTAVITGNSTLTYEALNQYANRVAHTILKIKTGNEKNQIAGLLFEHNARMIVGVIGTLKAGLTYLPLDITYPANRLVYMLEDSEASLVITNNNNLSLAEKLAEKVKNNITIINVDPISHDRNLSGENIQQNLPGDKLSYILYTSGSTGKPKGVMQTHENVWYYTRNWSQRFSISPADRMTLFSAFSHDGAGQDIFGALLNGATLYPYNILGANVAQLSQWLIRERISIWHSVPTLFRYFINILIDSDISKTGFPDLRFILLGGEQIRHHDIEMFKRFFPNSLLANVYGQTESSVSSIWMIKPGDSIKKILIGDPLDNTKILIVDNHGAVVENMGVGEIIVACKHIAPGYWKDKENSEKKFLHHPDLGRLYRTGDLGHLMADGSIECMGRQDSQVKIRGHRVEVGEIETTLLNHKALKEVVVAAKEDASGNTCLYAYYVTDTLTSQEGERMPLTVTGLKEYLSGELPAYMIPTYFIPLEKLPLTPNGKIDRMALAEVNVHELERQNEYVMPGTDVEKQIAGLWMEVLKLDKVGIHDNFFDLGGHSLNMMLLNSKLIQVFNRDIPMLMMLRYPTIDSFVQYLEEGEYDTIARRSDEKRLGTARLNKIRNRKKEEGLNAPGRN
jgi:amino acid adenylation domain-containing protein